MFGDLTALEVQKVAARLLSAAERRKLDDIDVVRAAVLAAVPRLVQDAAHSRLDAELDDALLPYIGIAEVLLALPSNTKLEHRGSTVLLARMVIASDTDSG